MYRYATLRTRLLFHTFASDGGTIAVLPNRRPLPRSPLSRTAQVHHSVMSDIMHQEATAEGDSSGKRAISQTELLGNPPRWSVIFSKERFLKVCSTSARTRINLNTGKLNSRRKHQLVTIESDLLLDAVCLVCQERDEN